MKKIILALLFLSVSSWANNEYFLRLQLKNAKLNTQATSILFEIHDAENNQLEAFQYYSEVYGKATDRYSKVLTKTNIVLKKIMKKYSDKHINDLKLLIEELDAIINESYEANRKIRTIIADD